MSAPNYRLKYHYTGLTGFHYFKVQRLGFLGLWWTLQRNLPLSDAKNLITILRAIDEGAEQ